MAQVSRGAAFLLALAGVTFLGMLAPSAPQAFVVGVIVSTMPTITRKHRVGWRPLLWDAAIGGALYLVPHLAAHCRTLCLGQ